MVAITAGLALYGTAAAHGATVGLDGGTVAALLARIVAMMAVYTVIGVGVGALLRNQVATLAVVVGYLTDAMAQQTGQVGGSLLSTAGGALLLLGYAAVAAGLAVAFPLRRDVT